MPIGARPLDGSEASIAVVAQSETDAKRNTAGTVPPFQFTLPSQKQALLIKSFYLIKFVLLLIIINAFLMRRILFYF